MPAPNSFAAIDRIPDPLPTSSTESPGFTMRSIASRHFCVQGCWPVPHCKPGLISRRKRPGGVGSVRHGATKKNFSPTSNRRPRVLSLLDPIDLGSFAWFAELRGCLAIVEERFDPAIVLDDAERSGFVQIGEQIR